MVRRSLRLFLGRERKIEEEGPDMGLRGLCCLLGCLGVMKVTDGWPPQTTSDPLKQGPCVGDPPCTNFSCCVGGPGADLSCCCGRGFVLFAVNKETRACLDVDECAVYPGPCPSRSVCINQPGSFACLCRLGYGGPRCTEQLPMCDVGSRDTALQQRCRHPGDDAGGLCGVVNATSARLRVACGGGGGSGDGDKLQAALAPLAELTRRLQREGRPEAPAAARLLLEAAELLVLEAAARRPGLPVQTFGTAAMNATVQLVTTQSCPSGGHVLGLAAGGDSVRLRCDAVLHGAETGAAAVAFIAHRHLEAALAVGTDAGDPSPTRLNSHVVSCTVGRPARLAHPVNVTLHHKTEPREDEDARCVAWQPASARWSQRGCERLAGDRRSTTCGCRRLSSFAVLMATADVQGSVALELVTAVGLSLSVLCLFLAILTFLLCRSLWTVSVALHLQLSACLFAADLLFLAAMRRVANQLACAIIAGLLHYLFLACFTWMFLEGLHLFLTVRNLRVVNYTSANRFKKRYIYPTGYGLPALVVAISVTINPGGYGTSKHCWLTTKGGFVWSFIGPVCAIILVNLVFYLTTLWILQEKLSTLNKDVSSLKSTRTLTFKALAQVVILGCTWGLGLLQTSSGSPVVAFLFTGLNSLQGVFIYVVHCLLNQQVTEQYQQWLRLLSPKADTTEVTMTSVNITSMTDGERPAAHVSEGCAWQK